MADICATAGAGTCKRANEHWSSFMDSSSMSHIAVLVCLAPLATFILLPLLWRIPGAFLGWYLRKKTDGRRCHIAELTEADEKKYRAERGENGGLDGGDVKGVGTAADADWDGIVGFFHPFW